MNSKLLFFIKNSYFCPLQLTDGKIRLRKIQIT